MPYIHKMNRERCDKVVQAFKDNNINFDGELNYILFKLCKEQVTPSYKNFRNFLGELNECVAEIRRRFLAPYEDSKISHEEHGDV